jgi:hypothetical protein
MLRIYAFSDFHAHHSAFERARKLMQRDKPDLVAITGDIANHSLSTASEFLNSLDKLQLPVLFLPGNMDDPALLSWKDTAYVKCLHGKSTNINDLTLLGLGGGPKGPFGTPFEYQEEEAKRILESSTATTGRKLGLIVHAPPISTKIDLVRGVHAGSRAVREFIEARQPLFSVSGHIHEAQGSEKIGKTLAINTGPALAGKFARINTNHEASVEFAEF